MPESACPSKKKAGAKKERKIRLGEHSRARDKAQTVFLNSGFKMTTNWDLEFLEVNTGSLTWLSISTRCFS